MAEVGGSGPAPITSVRRVDPEVWDDLAEGSLACTFFQTRRWLELVPFLDTGWEDHSMEIRFRDGVRAVVPRARRVGRWGVFHDLESVPVGAYGAPLFDGDAGQEHLDAVAAQFRSGRLRGSTLVETPFQALDLGAIREEMTTHLLDLGVLGDEDMVLRGYRKGHRYSVNKARKSGVTIEIAEGVSDYLEFHRIYLETVSRWSRRPFLVYPVRFFEKLGAASGGGPGVRLWVARLDEEVLGGVLTLSHAAHIGYWQSSATVRGRELGANHLALHEAILLARREGARWFDFLPSSELGPVADFKAGFGSEPRAVGIHRFPPSRAYGLARRIMGIRSGEGEDGTDGG